ncbi:hypothetical protein MSM1_19190 [Mycobacterium sp. SM1]|uniref:hypothetical protein n=1 Tax=Mycobacterium sp. SM1 TaxID=2816243 RepID=UPI001BCE8451|nr:hypothetical protein [Mycobacterium sp. SM1]MBS4730356.1 hypothetical protein [Mycobacterium sp. SM1]
MPDLAERHREIPVALVRFGVTERRAGVTRGVDSMVTVEGGTAERPHLTSIVRCRDERVIPSATSLGVLHLSADAPPSVRGRYAHGGHRTQIEHSTEFNRAVAEFPAAQGQGAARGEVRD